MKMGLAEHVACIEARRNACRILVGGQKEGDIDVDGRRILKWILAK
jgi:hypothetical protein